MQIKRRKQSTVGSWLSGLFSKKSEITSFANRKKTRFRWVRKYWRRVFTVFLALFLMIAAFGAGSGFGILLERKNLTEKVLSYRPDRLATNYLGSLGSSPDRLIIDIKHEHMEKLKSWRGLALERDQITADLKQYVPARIRFGDETYKVRLRLKGEWIDHVKTSKWSYRIKIRDGKTLLGMSCFGIQHPQVRKYSHEWFYHRALAREDVACLRYQFLAVTVNGRDMGTYAVEEHFTKEMIEHNRRRQGVVVRIEGDYKYHPYSDRLDAIDMDFDTGIRSQHASAIGVYDEDKLASNPVLNEQVKTARSLLQGFRDGKLSTHEVFDVEKLAAYFAVSELLGSIFTIDDWSDKRFLYNPVTSRIEPIGVEGGHEELEEIVGAKYNDPSVNPHDFHSQMFSDPLFVRAYIRALKRVSSKEYVDELLADLGEELDEQLSILHREWPAHDFPKDTLYRNAERIRAYLNPLDGMVAYLNPEAPNITLEMGAIQPLPVEVIEVVWGEIPLINTNSKSLSLAGKPKNQRVKYRTEEFLLPSDAIRDENNADALRVRYRLAGIEEIREAPIIQHSRLEDWRLRSSLMGQKPNVEIFPFLKTDEDSRIITFVGKNARVETNLIIPPGYTLKCEPGVTIDILNGASIASYSSLNFRGDDENPITVTSSDNSGQGLVVVNAKAPSRLEHVIFRGLSTPRQAGWELTGAVTFFQSPVFIEHCEFLSNDSEDGLNIVSSTFQMRRTHFQSSTSDALDGDFTQGKIVDCTFSKIGGDAIDFSGSEIEVENVRMTEIGDKGLSVGEDSILVAENLQIVNAGIGVASKDLSEATITDITVKNSKYAAAVFQKKSEYGSAEMRVKKLVMENNQHQYLVEKRSLLQVDDKTIAPNHKNVKELLYPED